MNFKLIQRMPLFSCNAAIITIFFRSPDLIQSYCKRISDGLGNKTATNDIESYDLYNFSLLFRRIFQNYDESCVSMNYKLAIEELKKDPLVAWYYQTCAEFGWYQTTDSENQPFGSLSPVEFHVKICQDVFGDV